MEFSVKGGTLVVDDWKNKLNQLKKWVDENQRRPTNKSKNKIEGKLANWYGSQQINYKKEVYSMVDAHKRQLWEKFTKEYSEYFLTFDQIWYKQFAQTRDWININKKRPSMDSEDTEESKMGTWIAHQQSNYRTKLKSMTDEKKVQIWEKFVENNSEYFNTVDKIWKEMYEQTKKWLTENKRCPKQHGQDLQERKIYGWITSQRENYKCQIDSMKDENKRKLWEDLVTIYPDLNYKKFTYTLKNPDNKWIEQLNDVCKWINKNKRRPKRTGDNEEKHFTHWIGTQIKNYNNKLMNENRQKMWEKFIQKYNKYMVDYDTKWQIKFDELKAWIDKNDKRPNASSKDPIEEKTFKMARSPTTELYK